MNSRTKQNDPIRSSGDGGGGIFQTAQQMFAKRTAGMVTWEQIPETLKTFAQAVTITKREHQEGHQSTRGKKGKKNQRVPRPTFFPQNTQEPFASKSNTTKGKGQRKKSNQSIPTQTGKKATQNMTGTQGTGIKAEGMGKRMELSKRKRKRKVHGERAPFVNIGI